jgi:hypothetical protein
MPGTDRRHVAAGLRVARELDFLIAVRGWRAILTKSRPTDDGDVPESTDNCHTPLLYLSHTHGMPAVYDDR